MLYTTYFAKLRKIPINIVPIAICGKAPQGYIGLHYKKLAPTYPILTKWKADHDNVAYTQAYIQQILSKLNATDVVNELYALANSQDIALVCYEKSTDFCHRHIIAEWLNEKGYKVIEWCDT